MQREIAEALRVPEDILAADIASGKTTDTFAAEVALRYREYRQAQEVERALSNGEKKAPPPPPPRVVKF